MNTMTTMKKSDIKLSIVVPVYEVEKYIEKCVSSLLIPDNDNYEIVVINDGTKDRSIDIIKERFTDSRIRIIEQANAGLSAARNKGIMEAKGEYIWFFDSDDWAETHEIVNVIKELHKIDFLYFNSYFRNNEADGTQTTERCNNESSTGLELACKHYYFCAPYYIMRKDFILQNGLSFEVGLLHEDTLFTPVMVTHAKTIKCYKTPVYHHRFRDGSITHSEVSPKRIKDLIYIIKSLMRYGNEAIPSSIKFKWGYCIAQTLNSVLFLSQKCNHKEAIEELQLYVNHNFSAIKYLYHAGMNNRIQAISTIIFNGRLYQTYKFLYKFRYYKINQ